MKSGSDLEPDYALIIIHYMDPKSVWELIGEALEKWTAPPYRVIVIDNSGDFGESAHSRITIVAPGANVGYGPAANLGVRQAITDGCRYALIATQDLRIAANGVEELLSAMSRDEELAVAAPLLAYRNSPHVTFSAGGVLTQWGRTKHPGQGQPLANFLATQSYEVDWADGACLLVRNDYFEQSGGFDESYFLYVEEVDLQYTLRSMGKRVKIIPTATASQSPGNHTLYLKHRNLTYFTRKYPQVFHRWPWLPVLAKDSLRVFKQRRWTEVLWGIRGYLDGRKRIMGPPPSKWWSPRGERRD